MHSLVGEVWGGEERLGGEREGGGGVYEDRHAGPSQFFTTSHTTLLLVYNSRSLLRAAVRVGLSWTRRMGVLLGAAKMAKTSTEVCRENFLEMYTGLRSFPQRVPGRDSRVPIHAQGGCS